jgi:hypothetical protein
MLVQGCSAWTIVTVQGLVAVERMSARLLAGHGKDLIGHPEPESAGSVGQQPTVLSSSSKP